MIYVETSIDAPLEHVWRHTQDPDRHCRWDLRFSGIVHLAGTGDGTRFRYRLRILPGLVLTGTGIATGDRHPPDGAAVSGLRFRADQRWSPLRSGSGYWKYVPAEDGVRFLTGYRYEGPRWSRPILGWATAWSFDRLRLWLETGRDPRRLLRRAWAEAVLRAAAAGSAVWLALGRSAAPAVDAGCAAPAGCPGDAVAAGAWPLAVAVLVAAILLPPLPGTPAARRCRRLPPFDAARASASRVTPVPPHASE